MVMTGVCTPGVVTLEFAKLANCTLWEWSSLILADPFERDLGLNSLHAIFLGPLVVPILLPWVDR